MGCSKKRSRVAVPLSSRPNSEADEKRGADGRNDRPEDDHRRQPENARIRRVVKRGKSGQDDAEGEGDGERKPRDEALQNSASFSQLAEERIEVFPDGVGNVNPVASTTLVLLKLELSRNQDLLEAGYRRR